MPKYELYHHGITGQKWGQKNGPPYPLSASQKSSAERKTISSDEARKRELMSKDKSELSNAELREVNNRLQLENTYDNLIRAGQKKSNDILSKVGNKVIEKGAEKVANKVVNAVFGPVTEGAVVIGKKAAEIAIEILMESNKNHVKI